MIGEISENDNEVTIIFDTRFYPAKYILKASEDFTDNFWVFVDGNPKDKMIVKIKPKNDNDKCNLKKIGYEFCNYIIGIIKEKDIF